MELEDRSNEIEFDDDNIVHEYESELEKLRIQNKKLIAGLKEIRFWVVGQEHKVQFIDNLISEIEGE